MGVHMGKHYYQKSRAMLGVKEVQTVRPNTPRGNRSGFNYPPRRFMRCTPPDVQRNTPNTAHIRRHAYISVTAHNCGTSSQLEA
jgi:hypothetical protein